MQQVKQRTQNRYDAGANLVKPVVNTAITRRPRMDVLPPADTRHTIDAAPVATQHVEMKTSAVDRSLGFLIASVPLYAGFALLVLLVSIFFGGVPFLSLPALVIFWLSFVAAWVVGYCYTLSISAEGVSHYEARNKWAVIREEQRRRWQHYERLTDQEGE
jgi:hypothetical protein